MAKTDPWFRFYTETTDDKKLKRAAYECRVERCFVLATWVALLAIAKKSPVEGKLLIAKDTPATLFEIGDEAGISSEDTVNAILQSFVKLDMIHEEGNAFVISHWNERQFKSDNSTERVQRHRAEKQNVPETLPKRYGNAPETESESETERESESETEQISAREPENEPEYVDLDGDQTEEDDFTRLQHAIEQTIGLLVKPDPANIKLIHEFVEIGATKADIQSAASWMKSKSKTVRYLGQLAGPIRTEVAKRHQAGLPRGDPAGESKMFARKQSNNGREDGLAAVREMIYGNSNDDDTET